MSLKQLSAKVRAAVKKLADIATGIDLADRRIRHFKKRLKVAQDFHHPELEARARRWLRYWRKRRRQLERLQKDWKGLLRRRRQAKERFLRNHPPHDPQGRPLFDGKPVAAWMVGEAPSKTRSGKSVTRNWLQEIRDRGWKGEVISGVRTPAESIHLCREICQADSCPGRCAGATSNHNCEGECAYPAGAIDATDPDEFNAISAEIDCPLVNHLPLDPNHHSVSGR